MDGAADPSGVSDPRPRTSSGARSWILVATIFLGVFALTATTVTDWRYHPTTGGAAYLPTDGLRTVQGAALPDASSPDPSSPDPSSPDPGSQGRVWENALLAGPEVGAAMPDAVTSFARSAGADLGLAPWRLWWRSTLRQESDGHASSRMFGYTTLGMVQGVTWDDTSAEMFLPALPVLPATGRIGETWTREGTTVTRDGTSAPYAVKGSFALAADPAYAGRSCAVSRLELTRGDGPAEVERLVFCPGAGLVDRLLGDQLRTGFGPSAGPAPTTDPAPTPDWDPSTWSVQDTAVASVRWPDAEDLTPIGSKTPAVTASGTFVVVRGNGADLGGLVLDGPDRVLGWTARPGGLILSVTTVGDLVIASTDDRVLVAYDDQGRLVWEQRQSAVSHTGAEQLGGGLLLVALKSGRVEVRRALDGSLAWEAGVAGSPTGPTAVDVASGHFYVGDDSGTVTAFSRDRSEPLWVVEVGGRSAALAATADGVVLRSGDEVMLFVDGERQWSTTTPGGGTVSVFADVVVVSGGRFAASVNRALDLADGTPRWSRSGVIARTQSAGVMVMADQGSLVAVDGQGVVLARADVASVQPNATLWPLPSTAGGGVWLWWPGATRVIIWGSAS